MNRALSGRGCVVAQAEHINIRAKKIMDFILWGILFKENIQNKADVVRKFI